MKGVMTMRTGALLEKYDHNQLAAERSAIGV